MKRLLSCLALLCIALSAVNAQVNIRVVNGAKGQGRAIDVYFGTVAQSNLVFSNIPPSFVTTFAAIPAVGASTIINGQTVQAIRVIITQAGDPTVIVGNADIPLTPRSPAPGGIGAGISTTGGAITNQAFTILLEQQGVFPAETFPITILEDPLVLNIPQNSAVVRLVMVGQRTDFPTLDAKLTEAQTTLVDIGLPDGTILVGGVNVFDNVFERFVVPAGTTQLFFFPARNPSFNPPLNPIPGNAEPAIPGVVVIPFGQQPNDGAVGQQGGSNTVIVSRQAVNRPVMAIGNLNLLG